MRTLLAVALVASSLLGGATGCGSSSQESSDLPSEPAALTADLIPLEERTSRFDVGRGRVRTLRVVPLGNDTADLVFEGGSAGARRLRVVRREKAVFLSAGPGQATEILRIGAEPGDEWETRFEEIQFDGWERVDVPAGSFDAARVTTRSGPDQLPRTETWWFVRGEGLVRLRSDHGGIFSEEMLLLGVETPAAKAPAESPEPAPATAPVSPEAVPPR